MSIGLALSGGVVRGVAHIGVLKYLAERRIALCHLAGTSAGSIVASLYCAGMPVDEIERVALNFTWKDLVRLKVPRLGLIDSSLIEEFMEKLIGRIDFAGLKIPLLVNAVDLLSGEEVVLDSGPVATAVRASCAIPGIFTPVKLDDKILVDGGLLNNVPAKLLRNRGIGRVIAVDLKERKPLAREPQSILEVLVQSFDIVQRNQHRACHGYADILIEPDLAGIPAWDAGQAELLIRRGYEAAREALAQPGRLRKKRRLLAWFRFRGEK